MENRQKTELHFLPGGKYFKKAIPGFEEWAADIYWIKTVLYFGRKARPKDSPLYSSLTTEEPKVDEKYQKDFIRVSQELSNLYYFINLVTELDPHFLFPYTFGGLFLSMKAGEYDRAIEILEKGEAVFPDNWRLSYIKGFNYFFYKNDIEKALVSFTEASKKSECPIYILNLSYSLMKKIGRKEFAMEFLTSLKNEKKDSAWNNELNNMINELKQSQRENKERY